MRYGIFSDVHSNIEALNAVVEAYRSEGIDRYLCLGDIVGYAANPKECLQLVGKLSQVIVAGNHDWGAAGKFELGYFNPLAKEAIGWTRNILGQSEIDLLCGLPLLHAEENFVLVHATLENPQDFCYLDNPEDASRTFDKLEKQICFVGHTHQPGIFCREDNQSAFRYFDLKITNNKKYIVNVGSVGQPRDGNPKSSFVIYDTDARTVELRRVVYDFESAQKKIIKAGLPKFLASRLGQGK